LFQFWVFYNWGLWKIDMSVWAVTEMKIINPNWPYFWGENNWGVHWKKLLWILSISLTMVLEEEHWIRIFAPFIYHPNWCLIDKRSMTNLIAFECFPLISPWDIKGKGSNHYAITHPLFGQSTQQRQHNWETIPAPAELLSLYSFDQNLCWNRFLIRKDDCIVTTLFSQTFLYNWFVSLIG
jgi:hypothetical protein